MHIASSRNTTAVLGPTNTGKTYLAVERMLGHQSGMIGLPLRLLAREVYDRIRARTGERAVAFITGEEKIVPEAPRYWVCTVEAMPAEVDVAFLAIDEIQMAADLERGHTFSDRVLNRRGREETMLLGAATMRPFWKPSCPASRSSPVRVSPGFPTRVTRRSAGCRAAPPLSLSLSTLFTPLPKSSGGSVAEQRWFSAHSRRAPATLRSRSISRGDVDYLVATDAIGMGLNMDVDHVAFAATRKFDGLGFRDLAAPELGQVAGRAGRYLNDGTFGLTGEAETLR